MSLPDILIASAALENANLVALGISHAYVNPPEAIMDFPVAIRYAVAPDEMSASRLMGRYNIFNFNIEVHFARGVLQESYANALACIQPYQDLYAANLSISGSCDVSEFRVPPFDGPMELRMKDGIPVTLGIVFYMRAKEILDDITVTL